MNIGKIPAKLTFCKMPNNSTLEEKRIELLGSLAAIHSFLADDGVPEQRLVFIMALD